MSFYRMELWNVKYSDRDLENQCEHIPVLLTNYIITRLLIVSWKTMKMRIQRNFFGFVVFF